VPRPARAGARHGESGSLLAVVVSFFAGAGLGVGGVEGVGDALVGGISLPIDAVGVDLQQDRGAVPGPPGDLGRWHPEFSHSDTAACRRSYRRRPSGERCWAGVRACLRASVQTSL
jgi:hypothetical protein